MDYVHRGRRKADLVREEDDYFVVDTHKDNRRVRWPKDGRNRVIEWGSLNPKNANYVPGGKALRTA